MISAVAQKYNIHPQTLRLYEREGLLKPSRTDGNTRLYSEEDLEQLETILSLDARSRRQPGRRRDHPQHAPQDRAHAARGQRVHGVRQAAKWRAASATGSSGCRPRSSSRRRPISCAHAADAHRTTKVKTDRVASDAVVYCRVSSHCRDRRMPCHSATTPAGSPSTHRTASAASCGATAGASTSGRQRLAGAEHPEALPALHDRELHRVQRIARAGRRAGAPRRRRVSRRRRKGLFLEGQPGVGKTHLAVAVLKQVIADDRRARAVLRHARPAARHPQHLRSRRSARPSSKCSGRS